MQRTVLITVALVIIAALGVSLLAISKREVSDENNGAPISQSLKEYSSTAYELTFVYPEGYYLKANPNAGTAAKPQLGLVLVEDTEENRDLLNGTYTGPAREGPISITVDVYPNKENLQPEAWVRKNSNWLSAFGDPKAVTVAGETGIQYDWDGLYVGKSVIVGTNGNIYVFSVTRLTPDDQILKDFDALLSSVSFGRPIDETSQPTQDQGPSDDRLIGAVAQVRELLMEKFNVSEGGVDITAVSEEEWTDSCLGLGGIAESCLQVITPGYKVTAVVNGEEYVYRTNADGSVIRKE